MPCKQHHAIKWHNFLFVVGRRKEKKEPKFFPSWQHLLTHSKPRIIQMYLNLELSKLNHRYKWRSKSKIKHSCIDIWNFTNNPLKLNNLTFASKLSPIRILAALMSRCVILGWPEEHIAPKESETITRKYFYC